jgi:type I restriction enzyme, S subunit
MGGEWETKLLGDVIELKRGYDLPALSRRSGSVPIVSSSGVSGLHDEAMAPGPGVVTGRYGTIGEVHYINGPFWPLNTTLYVRDFKGSHPRFVAYYLKTLDFFAYSDKAAVPGVNRNDLHRANVLWPPCPQQKAIAGLLGALDDKIESNLRMAETLEAMARALFKSWFVHFDPVRAKAEGRPTGLPDDRAGLFPRAFGEDGLPDNWEACTISDLCQAILSGGTPTTTSPEYWGGDIPWLSSGETRASFVINTEKKITSAGVENSSTRKARRGSTVIAGAGQGHTRGQTSFLFLDTYVNQSVVALQADPRVCSDLYLFFDLERRYEEFRQISDGQSSRGSLTTKLLGAVKTIRPERAVIKEFDEVVGPLVSRIEACLRQNLELASLRDALLPRLISGELRIRDADAETEAA